MPANLTPDYLAAEERFREAKTIAEKIECLEEMLATIPKHKGTDHLQAVLKRRLSKLREQATTKKGHGERFQPGRIERQGAGQIALIGPPNAGKSALLAAMTHAHPVVAPYSFSTTLPMPGMMEFEDVQVQLVDTPPITDLFMEAWMSDLLRRADAALLVADLASDDLIDHLDAVLRRLEKIRLLLVGELPAERQAGTVYRRCLLIANKSDAEDASTRLDLLNEAIAQRWRMLAISTQSHEGLEALRTAIWDLLGVIRIYSKPPHQKPDLHAPYIVPRGSTVMQLAEHVHKDFVVNLKFAKVWGADGGAGSARFPGQPVEREHVLADRDVVELHR